MRAARVRLASAALVCLVALGCGRPPMPRRVEVPPCVDPEPDEERSNLRALGALPEARAWLRGRGSFHGLATNRFGSTAEGLAFVERLYAEGASRVVIGDHGSAPTTQGANTLVVRLPQEAARRRVLFATCAAEPDDMGSCACDVGQETLFLAWD